MPPWGHRVPFVRPEMSREEQAVFCCIPRLHAPFPTNGRSASGPCEDFRQVAVGYGITPQHCPCTIRLIVPWPSRVWLVFETRWCIFVAPRRKVPILLRTSGGLLSDVSPLLGCDARGYSRGVKDTKVGGVRGIHRARPLPALPQGEGISAAPKPSCVTTAAPEAG